MNLKVVELQNLHPSIYKLLRKQGSKLDFFYLSL